MISVIQETNMISEHEKNSMYLLRGKTFGDRLKWKVNVDSGLESDIFDNSSAVYSLISDAKKVVACTRVLKTTNAYMLKDVFPELARGEKIPEKEDVLEISRFAIDKEYGRSYKGVVSHLTYELFRSLYIYAVENRISNYVIVTTVAAEKIMKHMGLPVRRFGDGKETLLGSTKSVGLWLDVNRKYAESVGH